MRDPQLIAHLANCRRSVTSVLLTLPVVTDEMTVETFVALLDHFTAYPEDYLEIANVRTNGRISS